MQSSVPSEPAHDAYAALREPSVVLYLGCNVIASIGFMMKDTAVLWEVFYRTEHLGSAAMAYLGLVGLVQAIPVILFPFLTGHVADRFDRKQIIRVSLVLLAASAIGLAVNSYLQGPLWVLYLFLFLHGTTRAFQQPARQSLLPQIVKAETFTNAVTWGSGGFHLAQVVGPIAAANIISMAESATSVYLIYALLAIVSFFMLAKVHHRPHERPTESPTFATIVGGVSFLFRNQALLVVMLIDLFAVSLGGATALFPVFQKQILQVDVTWLGWMRAAPAIGSVAMSVWIAHRPPFEHAGRAMLLSVVGYSLATMLFGMSTVLWFSMAMLIFSGACDIISVVVRHTLIQTLTPESMRGRVSALNGMFIGASNYLGDAEAGYVAAFVGPRISVFLGGLGSLFVAGIAAVLSPTVRRYGRVDIAAKLDEEGAREAEEIP
jgi:MFS family permease